MEDIARIRPPKGYSLRTYHPGDEAYWARIIASAFQTQCSANVFQKEIAEHDAFRPDRVFFLTYKGEPIGTATAWVKPSLGPGVGYLHMVAVAPEHTRKGLGKVLTAAVLRYFKQQNLGSAFLHTEEHRLAAVKTYVELGFEPVVTSEETREAWVEVFRFLGRPDLAHRHCGRE